MTAPIGDPVAAHRPRSVHLVRRGMYRQIERFFAARGANGDGLTVADWNPVLPTLVPGVRFRALRWPDHDLQDLRHVPDESTDFVASDMVLEHVEDPQAVLDASWRVLRPGGWALHTTVFLMPWHPSPIDPWRFSTEGLERLAARFGEVYAAGSGNRRLLTAVTWGLSRVPVSLGPSAMGWLFSGEQPRFAVCTWVAARK